MVDILQVSAIPSVAASTVQMESDRLLWHDVSESGAAQFKAILFDQAATLFGGSVTLLNPVGGVSAWAAHLAANPPTAAGQQRHYWDASGNFAWFASTGSAWVLLEGRRYGAASPLGLITPWGRGQRYFALSLDGYNQINVAASTAWVALGNSSSEWEGPL